MNNNEYENRYRPNTSQSAMNSINNTVLQQRHAWFVVTYREFATPEYYPFLSTHFLRCVSGPESDSRWDWTNMYIVAARQISVLANKIRKGDEEHDALSNLIKQEAAFSIYYHHIAPEQFRMPADTYSKMVNLIWTWYNW